MFGSLAVIAVSSIMQNGAIGAFFWLFDITGLFGDVLSYARLAGVGLASFYLGQSFNMVLGLFSRVFPGAVGMVIGSILGVVLFIIGHTLNILLGGMGCFVHSLRLCLVEFLTKFYDGGGKEYSPFKLRKRTAAPVLAKSH
jgi:V/A-type H+-transporting ATPase subunit I